MGDIFGLAIVRPFGIILMWIYQLVNSYGVAILLFALLSKLLMFPLSYKSKKSMLKMNAVNGQMKELQKKYAGNNAKLNEETQKLYQKEGVSPMGGCLPTLITFPIMMGLYYAVQQPLKYMIGLGMEDITLLGNAVGINVAEIATKSATYQLDIAQALNQFMDASGHFMSNITSLSPAIGQYLVPIDFSFMGLDLSLMPKISQPSLLWLIPILSGATAFLSSYVMQKMQGKGAAQMQGSMKTMMYMMPLMSVYFGFIFPASIGIYWIANNVFTMLQEVALTTFLNKRHPVKTEEQVREEEQEQKRLAHEEKMRLIAEGGVKPNPNTSRKKREGKNK